ncbi:MAG: LysO family transporter [Nitrososphaeria archaeon]|nr:LysO family transporter [Nitrososphaeria archaeon]
MIEAVIMLFIGICIGLILKKLELKDFRQKLDKLLTIIVIILLFVMGITLGSDNNIIYNLMALGYNSIILASLIFLGSIIFAYIFRRVVS